MGPKDVFVIASNNKGKIKEFKTLLSPAEIIPQSEIVQLEVDEIGSTFFENALLKARGIAGYTDHNVIADDSGLIVPGLNNEPGLKSARYASDDASDDENKEKLKNEMRRLGLEEMPAYFVCVLVMITSKDDPLPLYVEGRSNGTIKTKSIGDQGFGYDDMFYPDGYNDSFASINASTKLKLSHRGIAFAALKERLK